MGVPLNLKDIQSGFLTASGHTANNTLIEEALNKALDRTGSTDNAMETDLDMGLFNINNLKLAATPYQGVPLIQVKNIVSASTDNVTSTSDREVFTAVENQTQINLQVINYPVGANALMVFVNGVYQISGINYSEIDSSTIIFTSPLQENDVVVVVGAQFDAGAFFTETGEFKDESEFAAQAAQQSANSAQNSADAAEGFASDAEDAAGYKLDVNNQTGVSYTLVLEDEGDFVRMNNALENTITVPSNSSVGFDIGTIILVRQVGEGSTVINPGLGVTINAPFDNYNVSASDFGVALVKVDTDEWDLVKAFGGVDTEDLSAFNQEFDARLQDFYIELLSSDPTFVVNFDKLRNETEGSITSLQELFDDLQGNVTGEVGSFEQNLTQDFQDFQDSVDTRLSNIELDSGVDNFFGEFGYQKLPTGFTMQWGKNSIDFATARVISFPIVFDNACLNVQTTEVAKQGYIDDSYKDQSAISVDNLTSSEFTMWHLRAGDDTSGNPLTTEVYWYAIGY